MQTVSSDVTYLFDLNTLFRIKVNRNSYKNT